MTTVSRCLAALGAFVVAGAALAMDAFDAHAASVEILQAKPVQDELKITEAQRTRMNRFAQQHRGKLEAYEKQFQAQRKKNPQARPDMERLMRFRNELKNQVFGVLSASQLRRLREISLQTVGIQALLDDRVAKRIGISNTQLSRMRTLYSNGAQQSTKIQRDAVAPLEKKYRDRKPKNQQEAQQLQKQAQGELQRAADKVRPQLQQIQQRTAKAIFDVLTPQQRQAWQRLLGTPFRPPAGTGR